MSKWTSIGQPGHSKDIRYLHASGWRVTHCGHPTSNWPYYLTAPNSDDCIVSHNGLGFVSAKAAKEIVERIISGDLEVTSHNCAPNVRRVLCQADGSPCVEEVEVER